MDDRLADGVGPRVARDSQSQKHNLRHPTSYKQVILRSHSHEFHETCHSVIFYFMKTDSKQCCDTTTPESIHTKDESKRDSAFTFIFGVN